MQNVKNDKYERIFKQLQKLMKDVNDPIAKMSTIASLLHHKFNYYFWTGFYRLLNGELTVCCYQGSLACMVLKNNQGVCWKALNEMKTIIVPNVHKFPGHIACDSRSNSEIVIPVKDFSEKIVCVLDVDSKDFNAFDEIDEKWLEKIVELIY